MERNERASSPENVEDNRLDRSPVHSSVECSAEPIVHSMRHVQIGENPESRYVRIPSSVQSSTSSGGDRPINVDDGDYPRPKAGSVSTDQLAEHYSEMGSSSDEEQGQSEPTDKELRRHIKVLARGYKDVKENNKKLKAKADSYQSHIKSLKDEIVTKKDEIEQLKKQNAFEQIEVLKQEVAEMEVAVEMLSYGTQSKCGVCNKNCKIIDSHPYTQKVLEVVFGADYLGIFDVQQDQMLQPSSCKWKHLCKECDTATGYEEKRFKESLVAVLHGSTSMSEKRILLSHADLFHVYIFRALFRNIDIHHYIPRLEASPQCTCNNLVHSLNDFRKRAHHLSQPFIWKDRNDQEIWIDPASAGMLFYLSHASSPPDHWIEFPFISKVVIESSQKLYFIIFAQIPPFYWAFPLQNPLNLPSDVPNVFSKEMTTSKVLVECHYKEAMIDAEQLAKYFPAIIQTT